MRKVIFWLIKTIKSNILEYKHRKKYLKIGNLSHLTNCSFSLYNTIYDNVSYGPKIHGMCKDVSELDAIVEKSLKSAGLWDEIKDRLNEPGTSISGGQQQRLCIARAIATNPEVILMDEPCSALDPIATAKIEELIDELKNKYTIVVVTHNMHQAERISQRTAFFHLGKLIEFDQTDKIFTSPSKQKTNDYITGRYG